jgi:hypothetical protein
MFTLKRTWAVARDLRKPPAKVNWEIDIDPLTVEAAWKANFW